MNTPSIYTAISERQTRHYLVSCVSADSPEGGNVIALWAKNWSCRRLRVLTKTMLRRMGEGIHMAVFVPRARALNDHNFPWDEASLFQVAP